MEIPFGARVTNPYDSTCAEDAGRRSGEPARKKTLPVFFTVFLWIGNAHAFAIGMAFMITMVNGMPRPAHWFGQYVLMPLLSPSFEVGYFFLPGDDLGIFLGAVIVSLVASIGVWGLIGCFQFSGLRRRLKNPGQPISGRSKMETDPNPYSAPVAQGGNSRQRYGECPQLPLVFRTKLGALIVAIPFGIFFSIVACVAAFTALSSKSISPNLFIAVLVAFLAVFVAYAFFMSMKTHLVVTKSDLQIFDIRRREIPMAKIVTWNQTKANGPITITTQKLGVVYLSNWAMSKANNRLLGNALFSLLGPPQGYVGNTKNVQ